VGPDLAGVTARREREWLARFIKDPSQLFAAEDPIATQLLKEYGVPMPKLGLTAQQIEALIAYLQTTESPTAPTALPALYLPTLIAAVIAVVALTALGLTMGRKRVEVRP
jgi:cbb3-type cytochrome oxidase cytochrome c subunit